MTIAKQYSNLVISYSGNRVEVKLDLPNNEEGQSPFSNKTLNSFFEFSREVITYSYSSRHKSLGLDRSKGSAIIKWVECVDKLQQSDLELIFRCTD